MQPKYFKILSTTTAKKGYKGEYNGQTVKVENTANGLDNYFKIKLPNGKIDFCVLPLDGRKNYSVLLSKNIIAEVELFY